MNLPEFNNFSLIFEGTKTLDDNLLDVHLRIAGDSPSNFLNPELTGNESSGDALLAGTFELFTMARDWRHGCPSQGAVLR